MFAGSLSKVTDAVYNRRQQVSELFNHSCFAKKNEIVLRRGRRCVATATSGHALRCLLLSRR